MAERTRRRRLIYNEDGDTLGGFRTKLHEAPMSVEDYLSELFAHLAGTHVDTYVWCCGATHGLNLVRPGGERRALWMEHHRTADGKFLNVHNWRSWCNLQSFLQAGHNPAELVARGARDCGMELFFSLRMNDAHDAHDPDPEVAEAGAGGINPIKAEHPDWLIGEPDAVYEPRSIPWWMRRAFDYATEGCRDHVAGLAEEILGFDNDGIELDFMSHPFLFRLGRERQDAPLLTGLVRRVKALAAERGKSLMVRVPGSTERCERIGIDVRTWIREEIVDVLSLGRSVTPATIPTGEWMREVAGTACQVFPSINPNHDPRLAQTEALRAFAMLHLRDGAHGVYLFNFFRQPFSKHYREFFDLDRWGWDALREIGDLDTLATRDKRYIFDFLKASTPGRLRPRDPGGAGGPAAGAGRGRAAGPRALPDRRPPGRCATGDRAPHGGRQSHRARRAGAGRQRPPAGGRGADLPLPVRGGDHLPGVRARPEHRRQRAAGHGAQAQPVHPSAADRRVGGGLDPLPVSPPHPLTP